MLAILQAAGWPIWPLFFASIVAVALIIERLLYLRRSRVLPAQLLDEVVRVYHNGKVNAAFAKIPLQGRFGVSNDSRTYFLQNMVQYDPPIERIARLKFRFRFHDGRLVDFQNYNFDFSLEFNSLRNEINKSYSVRIPAAYTL